ncbi:MAG: hypothetical protein ACJA1L_001369 [Paracoccaceae bacterium]
MTFDIGDGIGRDQVIAMFEATAPGWRANPHLLHKNYLYDEAGKVGGGVYLWASIEAAHEAHGDAFKARIRDLFGSEAAFRYFETPVVVDNRAVADALSAA